MTVYVAFGNMLRVDYCFGYFACRFLRGCLLFLCSQACVSVKSPLRCKFYKLVHEQLCLFLVTPVSHKLFSCTSMFWTSLNPAKRWVLQHPTHQRCCVPANFLAFSLWLWVFLRWLQCCMVNKIQKLGCSFERYKWKKAHLKSSHLQM